MGKTFKGYLLAFLAILAGIATIVSKVLLTSDTREANKEIRDKKKEVKQAEKNSAQAVKTSNSSLANHADVSSATKTKSGQLQADHDKRKDKNSGLIKKD